MIVKLRPSESGTPSEAAGPSAASLPAVVPPVVVVMVTHDPGPWFEETLESLAAQKYADQQNKTELDKHVQRFRIAGGYTCAELDFDPEDGRYFLGL